MLDDVTFELQELTDLVTEVVDLATDAATTDGPIVDIKLDELVERVAERARRRSGHVINTEVVSHRLEGRRVMLERAVANLIDNAVKWSPGDVAVDVSLARGRLAVRDHGPGIDEEDRPHVFDRFFRATTARGDPGSGLGLSIVKRVVEDHGGSVFVEAAEGGGAVVGFTLPMMENGNRG